MSGHCRLGWKGWIQVVSYSYDIFVFEAKPAITFLRKQMFVQLWVVHNSIPIVSSSLLSHLYHIFNLPNNINYFSYAIAKVA
ncbi:MULTISPECIES: hypothetical protein [unclassified Wolbachia]|uniref:hypothetical protein n=1 Tax=unclassified Wolbachia TaxID=2640676 RepID=UPI0014289CC3|nr:MULTISPECIES: hypothetical protein [unclassified Wolbachia]